MSAKFRVQIFSYWVVAPAVRIHGFFFFYYFWCLISKFWTHVSKKLLSFWSLYLGSTSVSNSWKQWLSGKKCDVTMYQQINNNIYETFSANITTDRIIDQSKVSDIILNVNCFNIFKFSEHKKYPEYYYWALYLSVI